MNEGHSTPCAAFHRFPYEPVKSFELVYRDGVPVMQIERCTACGQLHHVFLSKPSFPGGS
jgi:hypothetical protein